MKIILIVKKLEDQYIYTGGQRRIKKIKDYLKGKGNIIYDINDIDEKYGSRNYLLNNIALLKNLQKYIRQDNTIILQDYARRFDLFLFNCVSFLFYNSKIIVMANAFYFSTEKIKQKIVDYIISYIMLSFSHGIITSGNTAKEIVCRIGVSKKKVFTSYPALREEFTELFGQSVASDMKSNDFISLIFVGGLHPRKGLEYLIQALYKLKGLSIGLYIIGGATNTKYEATLKNMTEVYKLNEIITFIGPVHDVQDLITFYKDSSIFVLPSIEDPSPISILEAMTAGLPVIATKVGGIPEFVEHHVNGLLVEPCNPELLANAILALYNNRALIKMIRENNLRKVKRYLGRTWDDVAHEYYNILRSSLKS